MGILNKNKVKTMNAENQSINQNSINSNQEDNMNENTNNEVMSFERFEKIDGKTRGELLSLIQKKLDGLENMNFDGQVDEYGEPVEFNNQHDYVNDEVIIPLSTSYDHRCESNWWLQLVKYQDELYYDFYGDMAGDPPYWKKVNATAEAVLQEIVDEHKDMDEREDQIRRENELQAELEEMRKAFEDEEDDEIEF